jgi:methylated-DNA-[protein]-cysteine S-methyltransferase
MLELCIDRLESALGTLLVVADGRRLCALDYTDAEERMSLLLQRRYGEYRLSEVADPNGFSSQIRAYFDGDVRGIDSIPVSLGGTDFQQQVWTALRTIPPGSVLSYGQLAAKLGKPDAYRAVGMSNALNPIAIVVPCHRLIGVDGTLTGYAGGLERKRWLLQHEGVEVDKLRARN